MGLEAQCACRWDGGAGMVKALLETRELILRGDLKRTLPIAGLSEIRVEGDELRFRAGAEAWALVLGAVPARRWASKLTTPPPTLAHKLGIGADARVRVIGPVEDAALIQALAGRVAAANEAAGLSIAVVRDAAALRHALERHDPQGPLWLVYAKGPTSPFGEAAVRDLMRAAGYIDVKVSAVSDRLSATRFHFRG